MALTKVLHDIADLLDMLDFFYANKKMYEKLLERDRKVRERKV